MTERGRSVLAIPVPAADPLLARAAELSPAARRGLPAHISLLYPFRPAADLDEATVTALAELLERQPAMEVRFERCHHHDGFVYLRPEPLQPLTGLIATLRRRWSAVLPQGSRPGDDVGAHLTVAMGASPREAAALMRSVEATLPLAARLTEAWLAVFDGVWQPRDRFRFRSPAR
ncbi:2'-5' RNA ligase family protein [Amycolatopsis tucumanensis]|uniref:2'-5' RNA ligase family protein n=1 Tax=Amycolatopsis tucumanensis TaxID=401106 RepID=UPI003D73BE96